ncbi:unnamed protein product [Psylliodes chrysocephalus]|uniref:Uncharacterized protein n=1 Tax=Psylliodes chrysocephalus TaxID=3402493 RepID=A0A9P0G405_9CUCU|nr:unnamed protein product [Psylliodes chrysocephala]
MCCQTRSWVVKGILISIWTIVQTSFHIIFVLGGYYVCQFKPSHYILVIFYITYFYAGISFKVKKCLSIIFYGPWLLVTCVSVLLDVTAAVHFGLDLLQIFNYTSWLRFIGVTNYQDFSKFNKFKSSSYVPHMSSITMTLFWSRLCIFWILNIVNFFSIVNSFGIAFRGIAGNDKRNKIIARRSNSQISSNQMNSSESRIRNWQKFYGTVETNSCRSSSVSSKSNDTDYNSNSRNKKSKRINSEERPKKVSGNSTTRYSLDSNVEFLSSTNSSPRPNSNYLKFQDVTEGVNTNQMYRRDSENEYEMNQRPWSYLRFNERPPSILFEHGEGSNGRARHGSLEEHRMGSTAM